MTDASRDAERLERAAGVRRLSETALRARGEDARTWLNGQITNDVRESSAGDSIYALAVDVRGKILSDLRVLDRGADFLLLLPADRRDAIAEHLDAYIVMEDVELEREEVVVLSVQGPRAGEVTSGLDRYPSDRLGAGGFDVVVAPERADAVEADLVARAEAIGGGACGEAGWELARLRAGRARLGRDFGPEHYPQEAGLEHSAVSFRKGCYLGQEVICMLENRGQLRRRLVRLEGDAEVASGDPLSVDEAAIGSVTSALRDPVDGTFRAMGYVKRTWAEPGKVVSTPSGRLTVVGVVGESPPGDAASRAL